MELYLSQGEWKIVQTAILIWGSYNSWHTAWELIEKYKNRKSNERENRPQDGQAGAQ